MSSLREAAIAAPTTLLVLSAVAGTTSTVVPGNRTAVMSAMYVTTGLLLMSVLLSRNPAAVAAVAMSCGVAVYGLSYAWKADS